MRQRGRDARKTKEQTMCGAKRQAQRRRALPRTTSLHKKAGRIQHPACLRRRSIHCTIPKKEDLPPGNITVCKTTISSYHVDVPYASMMGCPATLFYRHVRHVRKKKNAQPDTCAFFSMKSIPLMQQLLFIQRTSRHTLYIFSIIIPCAVSKSKKKRGGEKNFFYGATVCYVCVLPTGRKKARVVLRCRAGVSRYVRYRFFCREKTPDSGFFYKTTGAEEKMQGAKKAVRGASSSR